MDSTTRPTKKFRRNKYQYGTKFEELPNEVCLHTIFVYFDLYSLYDSFYGLNHRYNELVLSCQNLQLNLKNIPPSDFIPSIYDISELFSSSSVLSLRGGTSAQIDLLSEDRLFKKLIRNIKSLTFTTDISLASICNLMSVESFRQSIEYLHLESIYWKGCRSEKCSNDSYDEQESVRAIFEIAFSDMNKLKTLLIYFHDERYPEGVDFESAFGNIPNYRRDPIEDQPSNLERFVINYISFSDMIRLRELCPKLEHLQMRTDYKDKRLEKCASDAEKNATISSLTMMTGSYRDKKLTTRQMENLLSYFPRLSTLKVQQQRMQLTETEWDTLASKMGIDIVNVS